MAAGGGGLNLNMQETIVRLQESAAELATELNGLSDAQWAWRGEAGRWTVQEIVEHLILVEGKLLFLLRRTMQMPADKLFGLQPQPVGEGHEAEDHQGHQQD